MNQVERFLLKHKRFEEGSSTYKSYKNSLDKIVKAFNLEDEDYKKLNADTIEDWLEELDYKLSTINVILEHGKEFYEYLLLKHLVEFNPFKAISKYGYKEVANNSKKKYIPTTEEVKNIILRAGIREKEPINTFSFFGTRDKCILQLLASQGLRKGIIKEMLMNDIKKNDDYVVIEIDESRTKAKIPHRIVFGGESQRLFNKWLEIRKEYNINSNYVFTSIKGSKLSASNINDLYIKACKKAHIKVEKGVQNSPHVLRHYCASMLVANNENEILTKNIMNWNINNSEMIERYSNHSEMYDLEKIRATSFLG